MKEHHQASLNSVHQRCEWDPLKTVILGTSKDRGSVPTVSEAYDPTTLATIENNNFPSTTELGQSFLEFVEALESHNVDVLRPDQLEETDQIFARDVGFTIDNTFVASAMIEDRQEEWNGIKRLLKEVDVVFPPSNVQVEGGDVLILPNKLVVGYSEDDFGKYKTTRTNRAAVDWLQSLFPNREVIGVSLNKSDTDPTWNVLHLDCCFMPLGQGHYLIYKEGFKSAQDLEAIMSIIGDADYLELTMDEMMSLQSNLLSLSPTIILSDHRFERVNSWLKSRAYEVETINMEPVGRLGGLFRCSTLPLVRANS